MEFRTRKEAKRKLDLRADVQYAHDVVAPEHSKHLIDIHMENKVSKAIKRGRNVIRDTVYLPPEMWYFIKMKAEEYEVPNGFILECIMNQFLSDVESGRDIAWKYQLENL